MKDALDLYGFIGDNEEKSWWRLAERDRYWMVFTKVMVVATLTSIPLFVWTFNV